jgi:hypothetical protein
MKLWWWLHVLFLERLSHLLGFFVRGAVFFGEHSVSEVGFGVRVLGQVKAYVGWVKGFPMSLGILLTAGRVLAFGFEEG